MRAVIPEVPPDMLAWRKRTGADMWDDMWEGVLYMAPLPNREHQDLVSAMETYLRLRWARPLGNRVYHNINLASPGNWPNSIPCDNYHSFLTTLTWPRLATGLITTAFLTSGSAAAGYTPEGGSLALQGPGLAASLGFVVY